LKILPSFHFFDPVSLDDAFFRCFLPTARRLLRQGTATWPSYARCRKFFEVISMPTRSSGRKYGKKASQKVKRAMHEMKRGELKSGKSGEKVKSRKQAIAIGLSEARRAGGKVPSKKRSR
jgi:hypothetical protein